MKIEAKLDSYKQKVEAGRKPGARSQMLKLIMPGLSGPIGSSLAQAVVDGDAKKFSSLWKQIGVSLTSKIKVAKSAEDNKPVKKTSEKKPAKKVSKPVHTSKTKPKAKPKTVKLTK